MSCITNTDAGATESFVCVTKIRASMLSLSILHFVITSLAISTHMSAVVMVRGTSLTFSKPRVLTSLAACFSSKNDWQVLATLWRVLPEHAAIALIYTLLNCALIYYSAD